MNIVDKLPKWFPAEWRNKWFVFLIMGLIIFTIPWYVLDAKPLWKIVAFTILIFTGILYKINVKSEKTNFYSEFLSYGSIFIFVVLWFAYLAISMNEVQIAIATFFTLITILFLVGLVSNFINLWDSETLISIILTYLIFSGLVIFAFGFLYASVSGFENESLFSTISEMEESSPYNFLYYSSSVYFIAIFGDLIPLGMFMKIISMGQAAFSAIIHVIVISAIISRNKNKKVKR